MKTGYWSGFFPRNFKCRIKNIVPQRIADPETAVVFLVMVEHVVLFDALPEWMAPSQVVHGIMHHIVTKVAEEKSCKKRIDDRLAQKCLKTNKKQQCQWNTQTRRHHQAKAVVRVIVVYAMPYKMQTFAPLTRWHPMEQKAMEHVFSKCPDEQTGQKQTGQI